MRVEPFRDAETVARAAAAIVAAHARAAADARGRFVLAVSGGRTPAPLFRALAREQVPWRRTHVIQVDERVAPEGHADRNLTGLRQDLLARVSLPAGQVHPMPVQAPDLDAAAAAYGRELAAIAGSPPVLDLVLLGLGTDGHTASLVPGDPALAVTDADVAVTAVYEGRRRMTLTYPILNRARHILWVVTGTAKAAMLARLLAGDRSIPAGRVSRAEARVLADGAAAGRPGPGPVE